MAEFDKYNGDPYNNDNGNSHNYDRKEPEYSFWAEQLSGGSNYDYNTGADQRNTNQWNTNQWNTNQDLNVEGNDNNKRSAGKVAKFILKSVCFGAIAAASFFGITQLYYQLNPDAKIQNYDSGISGGRTYEIGYTKPGAVQVSLRTAISDMVDSTMPSIVSINSTSTQPSIWFGQQFSQEVEGSGSGIIVGQNENELLVATNNHVVAGTDKITVTFADGKEADAVIKGTDATADLAVISVDTKSMKEETIKAIKIAKLGNSDDIKVGEMSIAIGNALGYGQSVTVGYISAKDREVILPDGYSSKTMVLLQTDAAINPGNSGGALLNTDGEVIGINTVKYATNEVEGMGYAIPITRATPIINELMSREILKDKEQGFLGIAGNDVTEEISKQLHFPIGVFINEVTKGSGAEKAGLKAGDIITAVNDIEVTSITQLRDYVTSIRVGTEVTIKYMRNSNGTYVEDSVKVTLGPNPNLKTTR